MTKRQLEELLHHESFLQWLARRLLRDAARADDVVQETWLAVLHSNKSPSEVHRGWLAAVLRNLARRKLREERRRTRREQLVARPQSAPAAPSPLDAEELRVRLAKLVLGLPVHYREALLLRYYEGLEPADIAARTGVPASTVRTRIQRGLARIRTDLDGASLSVAPLLAMVAGGKPVARMRVMPLAAAAAIVLITTFMTLRAPREKMRAGDATRQTSASLQGSAPGTRAGGSVREARTGQGGADALRATEARILNVAVTLPRGLDIDSVRVEVTATQSTATLRTTAGTAFLVDLSPLFAAGTPLRLGLRLTHPACKEIRHDLAPATREVAVTMQRRALFAPELLVAEAATASVIGAATEATTTPADGARKAKQLFLDAIVRLPDGMEPEPVTLAICGGDACLRFRIAPSQPVRIDVGALLRAGSLSQLVVRASSRRTVAVRRVVPVWAGPRLDRLELRLAQGRLATGQVTWQDGAVAAGVTVAAFGQDTLQSADSPRATTLTDAQGAFEIALPERADFVLLAVAAGVAPAAAQVAAIGSQNVSLVLREGAAITGVVAAAWKGRPVRLFARDVRGNIETGIGTVAWSESGPRWCTLSTRADDRGAFRFAGLSAGVYTIEAAGEQRRVDAPGHVEFAARPVRLTVATVAGDAPLPGALVTIADSTRTTNARGRATFVVAVGSEITIHAEAKGYESARIRMPAAATATLHLRPAARLGRLRIDLDAGDVPLLAAARLTLAAIDRQTAPFTRKGAIDGGTLGIDHLAPGAYEVRIDPGGWHSAAHTVVTIIAGETTRTHMRLTSGGRVQARLLNETGQRVPIDLLLADEPQFQAMAQRKVGDAKLSQLASMPPMLRDGALIVPGRYQLWLVPRVPWAAPVVTAIEVRAGRVTEIIIGE